MTKVQRRLLIKARRLIERNEERYICFALLHACEGDSEVDASVYLRAYIEDHLDYHLTLDSWIRCNRPWLYEGGSNKHKWCRLAWIDWMLGGEGICSRSALY